MHPHHVDEIRLWENVDYKDGFENLLVGPRDMRNDVSLSGKFIESKMLELLLIAFERESRLHDLIAYVSPQNHFKMDSWKSIFTDIRTAGAYYGNLQQTMVKNKTTYVSFAHLDVVGFRTTGVQFKTLVTDTLKCLRRYQCDDDVRRHITQMDHFFSWGLHEPEGLERTNTESSTLQFFCNIRLREDIMYAKFNENLGHLQRDQESSPISILAKKQIAILMPTLSHSSLSSWKETAPIEYFLPSFFETVTPSESEMFSYIIYIGFDEGDKYFDNESHLSEIRSYINQMIPSHITLSVRYIRFPYSHGWVTFIWNGLFSIAYNAGCNYFFQVNDDLSLIGSGWTSKMVQKLEDMDGLGVIGPYDRRQNGRILTQAFVSRKHYEIFGTFFPIEIKDWYSDNW
ncbi:hypothetical protein BKA69DRAFT_603240 [Paraphysoderma sedebokerense]|nr:hypothetical protein BKA69DRAFT_603240 [Paraphysoderma sedebokerense]